MEDKLEFPVLFLKISVSQSYLKIKGKKHKQISLKLFQTLLYIKCTYTIDLFRLYRVYTSHHLQMLMFALVPPPTRKARIQFEIIIVILNILVTFLTLMITIYFVYCKPGNVLNALIALFHYFA